MTGCLILNKRVRDVEKTCWEGTISFRSIDDGTSVSMMGVFMRFPGLNVCTFRISVSITGTEELQPVFRLTCEPYPHLVSATPTIQYGRETNDVCRQMSSRPQVTRQQLPGRPPHPFN